MDRPNLFDYATGELSQDAFLCWLLSWADRKHRATDEALHRTAYALLRRLFALCKIEGLGEVESLEVERQHEHIAILVLVNSDLALLIEDKTDTFEHSGQLPRYLDAVRQEFKGRKIAAVYFKTGDQCDYRAVEQAGYACFLRRDFLDVLEQGERAGVRHDVFVDFLGYLRKIEEAVSSFRHVPVDKWGEDRPRWAGFFTALQEWLGEGRWGYVANPSGGFMGFWWHWKGDKYLQLEEDQLCFTIMVKEKARQAAAWQAWHETLMAEGQGAELRIARPGRRRNGTYMTVAVLDGDYLQADEKGVLDLDRTVAVLRKAEALLDAAAAKSA
jgi:hypothetical protein